MHSRGLDHDLAVTAFSTAFFLSEVAALVRAFTRHGCEAPALGSLGAVGFFFTGEGFFFTGEGFFSTGGGRQGFFFTGRVSFSPVWVSFSPVHPPGPGPSQARVRPGPGPELGPTRCVNINQEYLLCAVRPKV